MGTKAMPSPISQPTDARSSDDVVLQLHPDGSLVAVIATTTVCSTQSDPSHACSASVHVTGGAGPSGVKEYTPELFTVPLHVSPVPTFHVIASPSGSIADAL